MAYDLAQPLAWRHNLVYGFAIPYDGLANLTGIDGNLAADPQLQDPANLNFELAIGSPALDTGLESLAPVNDFLGRPRPVDGDTDGSAVSDIGAFERQLSAVEIPATGRVGVVVLGVILLTAGWLLLARRV